MKARLLISIVLIIGLLSIISLISQNHTQMVSSNFAPRNYIHKFEYFSPSHFIDKKYKSMLGPLSDEKIILGNSKSPELLWIVGYEAVMVKEDEVTSAPQEFMCHSNLDFSFSDPRSWSFQRSNKIERIFTLSQGQYKIRFPKGFGLPAMSNEPLKLETQVLNLNLDNPNINIRNKVIIEYVMDKDLKEAMKSLFTVGAQGLIALDQTSHHYGVDKDYANQHGPGCLIGQPAGKAAMGNRDVYRDEYGHVFAGHWVVRPGREITTTLATKFMNIPFDTTIHYIAVHLHPFAESLELRDRTTGQSVFKSNAENFKDRIGLAKVDYFSSEEGIPIYKDHDYEIISVYNNTSKEDQDVMAVMILFLHDKQFQKPTLAAKQ